jgi:hypothetical protein
MSVGLEREVSMAYTQEIFLEIFVRLTTMKNYDKVNESM